MQSSEYSGITGQQQRGVHVSKNMHDYETGITIVCNFYTKYYRIHCRATDAQLSALQASSSLNKTL